MRLSLFIEITVPRPWEEDTERRIFNEVLEEIELADQMGFQGVWITEHHFMEEFCHATAPEVVLAAAARTTKQIRLGHGIVSMPPGVNHPARVAERISTLDLVSNGRAEFGTGESSSVAELGGFGIDPGKKREMWREGVRVATRCMSEEPFTGFDGEFVSMPSRNVVPKPMQKPHPPVWVACTRPDTITMAAENGLGALAFLTSRGIDDVRERVENYYSVFEKEAVPLAAAPNPKILYLGGNLMCAKSDSEAIDRVGNLGGFFPWVTDYYYLTGDHHPGRDNLWDAYLKSIGEDGADDSMARWAEATPSSNRADDQPDEMVKKMEDLGDESFQRQAAEEWPGIGSPETIKERIRPYEDTGLDEFMFQLPPVPHEHIMESIELVGREVIPELHARDDERRAKNRQSREAMIEAVMSRRNEDDIPEYDPEYSFGGIPKAFDSEDAASEIAEARLGMSRQEVLDDLFAKSGKKSQ